MNIPCGSKHCFAFSTHSSLHVLFVIAVFVITVAGNTLTAGAATLAVPAGGDLQAAINAAQFGDTVVLQAGATYKGSFSLPPKSGGTNTDADYITIRTSNLSGLPADGQRVTPAHASAMAKLVLPDPGFGSPLLSTYGDVARYYKLIGLEMTTESESTFSYQLVVLGDDYPSASRTLAAVAHHFIIDRCYIHAWPRQSLKRGIMLNSSHTKIINSHISGFKAEGQDTQAIMSYNSPGPFQIVNNYLEAAGENIIIGGADPAIPNLVPSDILISRNYFYKPLSWRVGHPSYAGKQWSIKNLFELKNAQRVTIDGNVFENNWAESQGGIAIVLTPRNQDGTAPWSVVRDVTFTNNIVRHAAGAVSVYGADDIYPSQRTENITIRNNVFDDINESWGSGGSTSGFMLISGPKNLTVDHNTVTGLTTIITIIPSQNPNLVFTNNIVKHQNGGIIGEGLMPAESYITQATPHTITGNLLVGAKLQYWDAETRYPPGNRYPDTYDEIGFVDYGGGHYSLGVTSPYKGTASDGTDPGCNIEALNAAISGVQSTPTASPTPSPEPTPEPSPTPTPTPDDSLSISVYDPTNGSTFAEGSNITISANTHTSATKVEFYQNNKLIATDTSSPFGIVWSNVPKGEYTLTGRAFNSSGGNTTSNGVSISVKKSPASVNKAKGKGNGLASSGTSSSTEPYAGAADGKITESLATITAGIDSLIVDIEQAYADFLFERISFGTNADRIETQLLAAYHFTRSNRALSSKLGYSESVRNNLRRIVAHLAMTEDLMLFGFITPATTQYANSVNARANVLFGPASAGYEATASSMVPASLGYIFGNQNVSPLGLQSLFAPLQADGGPTYELGGVNVTVGGQPAPVVFLSPARISFSVPPGLPSGTVEVLVTSQHGYISRGTATIAQNIIRLTTSDNESGRALVVNALGQSPDSFDVTTGGNFGSDKRTRLTLFATGISGSAANTNLSNDLTVNDVFRPNFAESVVVEARKSTGPPIQLPVEFAGAQGNLPGMDQVIVTLVPSLKGAGTVRLTLIINGQRSNTATVVVR